MYPETGGYVGLNMPPQRELWEPHARYGVPYCRTAAVVQYRERVRMHAGAAPGPCDESGTDGFLMHAAYDTMPGAIQTPRAEEVFLRVRPNVVYRAEGIRWLVEHLNRNVAALPSHLQHVRLTLR